MTIRAYNVALSYLISKTLQALALTDVELLLTPNVVEIHAY